jgi:hypothetical protein
MELNSQMWNSGDEAMKEIVKSRKRQTVYVANVLVVKDSAKPENNGTVRLYRFGAKIFDKLNGKINPAFEGEESMNPFDFWEGANFKLKIMKVAGFQNYDQSEFDAPSAIAPNDAAIQKIWEQEHSLQALIAPDQFKSYDELKKNLEMTLNSTPKTEKSKAVDNDGDNQDTDVPAVSSKVDEDDDEASFFARMNQD